MSEFEYFLSCLLIPIVYVLTYIAGKYDLLGMICRMLEEKAKALKRKEYRNDDGKGCETCKWSVIGISEVDSPCWDCKGNYSEYAKSMSSESFELFLKVLKDMGELKD